MLNKFIKTIHKKYSKLISFIFFLRYLFLIFFIAISLFLIIPNFFNYEKKAEIIKNNIFDKYNLEVKKFEKINFRSLPVPSLEIKNVELKLRNNSTKLKVKNLVIKLNLLSIYNYKNFKMNKIILNDIESTLTASSVSPVIKGLLTQKNKISLNNLNFVIVDEGKSLFNIKNINFINFGLNKNKITGEIFNKNFNAYILNEFKNIKLEILNSGISANIEITSNQNENFEGELKTKILNNKLKFNFDYKKEKLNILNLYFRSKYLSLNGDSLVKLNPFLEIKSNINIEELNNKIFKIINFNEILKSRNLIKKLNIESQFFYKSKKFNNHFVDKISLKTDLAYGRINYSKEFFISESFFKCNGNINLMDEIPLLFFNCKIQVDKSQKFFKNFLSKIEGKYENLILKAIGNYSAQNNKINFKKISINENYVASKEDLKFFKETFERIFLDKELINIFEKKNIKDFILEVN